LPSNSVAECQYGAIRDAGGVWPERANPLTLTRRLDRGVTGRYALRLSAPLRLNIHAWSPSAHPGSIHRADHFVDSK
jgi:hypothetical protein